MFLSTYKVEKDSSLFCLSGVFFSKGKGKEANYFVKKKNINNVVV